MHVPSPSFAVNGIAIGEVAKVKYLGHVITNDMTDDADMMRQRRQLYALGNVLSRRFHTCSIEVKNKVGPCPFGVVNNGAGNFSLHVLSNIPECNDERYQNNSNAISKI